MKKLLHWSTWLGIITSWCIIVVVVFWEIFPYNIIMFTAPTFPVMNKTVKQGEMVKFVSNYCKFTDISADVSRIFKNEILFYTPPTVGNIKKGCSNVTVAVTVPSELPSGSYVIENVYQYRVNPIRTVIVRHDTDEFRVVEK